MLPCAPTLGRSCRVRLSAYAGTRSQRRLGDVRPGERYSRVMHLPYIGGMMLISQMDIILGVDSAATRSAGSTLLQAAGLVERLGGVRLAPLLLGVMVMAAATLAARLSPRAPAPLVGDRKRTS